jgi:uncharacterized tellurite resistance protein B-like protein
MLDAIRTFFARNDPVAGPGAAGAGAGADTRRLQLAACALLLEIAHADDTFSDEERRHIEGALVRHFGVGEDAARELIALAQREREEAVDLFQFGRVIRDAYDEGQRLLLAEIMWGVVHADGQLSRHEDTLMQRLAKLLDLRPGFLAEARRRSAGS